MWSVFLFVRRFACAYMYAWLCMGFILLCCLLMAPGRALAAEGRASFASLLAGGLSPVGLGGYNSTPARYAIPSYGVSYYWLDDVVFRNILCKNVAAFCARDELWAWSRVDSWRCALGTTPIQVGGDL